MTYHPVIQKEVNELLAKGTTEPFAGGAVFYAYLLFHCVLYDPFSTLNYLITICLYLILRCLLSEGCCFLFDEVIMHFLFISRILIYILLYLGIVIPFISLTTIPLQVDFFSCYYIFGRYPGPVSPKAYWQEKMKSFVPSWVFLITL